MVPDCPTKGCLHLTDNCVCAQSPSPVHLFATLWTVAHQAPPSLGFPRQEFWSGLAFPSPGDLPSPGVELSSPEPPALQEDSFPTEPLGKPRELSYKHLRASHAKPLLRLPWVIPRPGSRHWSPKPEELLKLTSTDLFILSHGNPSEGPASLCLLSRPLEPPPTLWPCTTCPFPVERWVPSLNGISLSEPLRESPPGDQ